MPSTRDILDAVVDPAELGRLIGRPARITRLRIKPGVSLSFALAEPTGSHSTGWGRLLWPGHHGKADKAEHRARRLGLSTEIRQVEGGLLLQLGDIYSDPRLAEHIAAARESGILEGPEGAEVLRYNPLRRLVAGVGEEIVRITARAQDQEIALTSLLEGRVPVPPRTLPSSADPTDSVHITAMRKVGDTDLSAGGDAPAAQCAGAALAMVHSCGGIRLEPPKALPDLLEVHAGVLDSLAPDLAARVRRLGRTAPDLPAGEAVLSHGDFSADQVLHDTSSGRIWLTDFDRMCLAPPEVDLGSYLDLLGPNQAHLQSALLDGYADAGGRLPNEDQLWWGRLRAASARLAEPLRRGEPRWRVQIEVALARLEDSWARA